MTSEDTDEPSVLGAPSERETPPTPATPTPHKSAVTLGDVQRINDARKARWHEGGAREWSVLEWAGAMCGEAGEAANVAKKLLRIELGLRGNEAAEHVITERDALRKKLAGEIGGTVLYAALLASVAGLDFEELVVTTFDEKSEALGFPERLSGLRAEASQLREATLNELRERIVRQAKSLPLGASWVGGGLDGASIYNSYLFAADLVNDALRSALASSPTETST